MISTNQEHPLTTEYHLNSSTGSKNSPLLVFIPGNPGLIDYYTTYLDLIGDKYPEYDILAIGHAGFQTSDDYVRHKCSIIKKRVLLGHTRLSFLCHSVGGYITQRVVASLLKDDEVKHLIEIEFVGLICPTIVDIAKSDSGVLFTKLFSFLPVVQLAVCLLAVLQVVLSDSMARSIISRFVLSRPRLKDAKSMESWQNAVNATYKIYKSRHIARQALTLARQELQVIHRDDAMNDWFFHEIPTTHKIRVWCFFAESDYWVHDNTRDYILGRYHSQENRNVQFQVGEPSTEHTHAITHAFCIDQSVEFAQITCAALATEN